MKRSLNILGLFWTTSLAAEAEYRFNFFIAVLAAIAGLAASVFGVFLVYRRVDTIAGWTWPQAMIVMGIFTLLEGLTATFLAPNLGKIVRHVQNGTLDFVLLKPFDSQLWLSTRNLSLGGVPDLVLGLVMLGYAAPRAGVGVMGWFVFLVPLTLGVSILYSLWFMLATTSIWFVKIYNASDVFRSFLEAARFPVSAYPAAFRFVFTFILPVAFLTTIPAETMLGRAGATWIWGAVVAAAALAILSRRFWRFALMHYTSASS